MKEITRQELKGKSHHDFKDGLKLHCGKYVVFINGLNTRAELYDKPMISLKAFQMPSYIRDLVF